MSKQLNQGINLSLEFINCSLLHAMKHAQIIDLLTNVASISHSIVNQTIDSSDSKEKIISVYMELSHGYLTLNSSEQNCMQFNIFLQRSEQYQQIPEHLLKIDYLMCDTFGWPNCTSSQTIERGGSRTRYLLNEDTDQQELYKDFHIVYGEITPFQKLRVIDSDSFGRALILDDFIQVTDEDKFEDFYSETLALNVVPRDRPVDDILIIGGGDMKIATLILCKCHNVKKLTMCEIDERVVLNYRKYFKVDPIINASLANGRFNLVFMDGCQYVKDMFAQHKKFAGIIIDNTDVDLVSQNWQISAEVLFNVEFYKDLKRILEVGGVFSTQLTEIQNIAPWTKLAQEAGFQTQIINSPTPEYNADTPMGFAKNI